MTQDNWTEPASRFKPERRHRRSEYAAYSTEVYNGEELDTAVTLTGVFAVAGCNRTKFDLALTRLIEEYRI